MLPPSTPYPRFVANQLLTEKSLNEMVEYFDGQVRDTRIFLIGLGIYYGLEVKTSINNGNVSIMIEKGIGVSSEGFLFKLEADCMLTSYAQTTDLPKNNLVGTDCPNLSSATKTYAVNELTPSDGTLLTQSFLTDKVIVFICEQSDAQSSGVERCFNELDEKGVSISNSLRFLLMNKSDVDELKFGNNGTTSSNVSLPTIFMRRFGIQNDGTRIDLSAINSAAVFSNNYKTIFINSFNGTNKELYKGISRAYEQAQKKYNLLFDGSESGLLFLENKLKTLFDKIFPTNSASSANVTLCNVQYFYDYLKDLILAYEEFACLEIVQQVGLFPDKCDFPKYLLLDLPFPNSDDVTTQSSDQYRTMLQRPPIDDIGSVGIDEAKTLFERMVKLVNQDLIAFPIVEPIYPVKITPSRGRNLPLSDRAIPFYYKVNELPALRECWNPVLRKLGKIGEIPCYHPSGLSAPYDIHLLYDLDKYDFLRIEGHIGRSLNDAIPTIEEEQKKLNVPFDIQEVKLQHDGDLEEEGTLSVKIGDLERLYLKVKRDIECLFENNPNLAGATNLLPLLPDSITNFDFPSFKVAYDIVFGPSTIIKDCNDLVLEKLAEEYQRREDEYTKLIWFHHFVKKHPGLEHMGGVYKGGTLVLVYIELDGGQNTKVVADFCLPYNCCSNSPSVHYQVSPIDPQIIMKDSFCSDDDTPEPIVLIPSGGTLTMDGNEIQPNANGAYFFVPNSANPSPDFDANGLATITFEYDFKGLIDEKEITLQQPPALNIDNTRLVSNFEDNDNGTCQLISKTLILSETEGEAEELIWQVNGEEHIGNDIEIIFEASIPDLEISVVGSRGGCSSSSEKTIPMCPTPISILFGGETNPVFQKVGLLSNKEPLLELDPIGGILTLSRMNDNEVFEIFEDYELIIEGTECDTRTINFNILSVDAGFYRWNYNYPFCEMSTSLDFEIQEGDDDDDDDTPEGDDDVTTPTPSSRRMRASSPRPATPASSKSKSTSKATPKKSKSVTPKKKSTSAKKKTTTSKKEVAPVKAAPKPSAEKLQNGARIMNLRRTSQHTVLKKMEEDTKLVRTKSFGLSFSFLLFPGNDLLILNQRFEGAMSSLFSSVKRAKDQRKKDLEKIVEVLLHNYLDKRVALTPKKIDAESIALIQKQIDEIKKQKLNLKAMHKAWKGKDLETALKATVVGKINSLFK